MTSRSASTSRSWIPVGTFAVLCYLFIQAATAKFEWRYMPSSLDKRHQLKGQEDGMDVGKLVQDHPSISFQYVFTNGTVNSSPRRLTSSLRIHNNTIACPPSGTVGVEMNGGSQVLHKIRKGILKSQAFAAARNATSSTNSTPRGLPRILCMVYTYEPNHATNLQAIVNTWATRCDGFFAASNATNHSLGAIDFSLYQQGPEEYGNMWQKIRAMWHYAYQNYRHDYDYFNICGDDVYVVPDNLRAFLGGPQVSRLLDGYLDEFSHEPRIARVIAACMRPRPLLLGQPMVRVKNQTDLALVENNNGKRQHRWPALKYRPITMLRVFLNSRTALFYNCSGRVRTFPSGGTGYTLNRAALDFYMERGYHTFCVNTTDPREDAFMGGFFNDNGIWVSDARDETNASRYGGEAEVAFHFDGIKSPINPMEQLRKWGVAYNKGIDSASEQTVSFHLKDRKQAGITNLMYRYHALLYGLCPADDVKE